MRRSLRFVNCGETPFRVLDRAFDAGAVQLVVNEGRTGSAHELALLPQCVAKLVFYPPRPMAEGGVTGRGRVLVLCRKQGYRAHQGPAVRPEWRRAGFHRMPGTAAGCGQPRPSSLLGRAGRPMSAFDSRTGARLLKLPLDGRPLALDGRHTLRGRKPPPAAQLHRRCRGRARLTSGDHVAPVRVPSTFELYCSSST